MKLKDKVLIIEDEQSISNFISTVLSANGYETIAAGSGKVLTYDYMIRETWGPKAKADNQILRVNMANIRRKIEKNPAAPEYIFTEIGAGYRMRDEDE